MLKTTKRFLGQQRFERLSKVFWCENFAVNGGCLYDTPSGGVDDAVLWPVRPRRHVAIPQTRHPDTSSSFLRRLPGRR